MSTQAPFSPLWIDNPAGRSVAALVGIVLFLVIGLTGARRSLAAGETTLSPAAAPKRSIMRVNVTRQNYNFHRPWQQRPASSLTAIGVVIAGPRILVTAEPLANARYIELETIDTGVKSRAQVDVVDHEANLALLRPIDPLFLAAMQPLELTATAVQGDRLAVWQVKPNGNITPSIGPVTSVELTAYPHNNYFLVYRLNNSLQYGFGNTTLPVVRDGKLAGLAMRYDAKSQTIDVLAAPVIAHFLEDAAQGGYQGFPNAGLRFLPTLDPQLRRHEGIPDDIGGVYVQAVIEGLPAHRAGVHPGDILFQINGYRIDRRGNYPHPLYGKMAVAHLIRCDFQTGETLPLKIYRDGQILSLSLVLNHRKPSEYLVPPYIVDRQPRYYILGGLVLLELSAPYLHEYGKRWQLTAPIHFVYYNRNQDFMKAETRDKIVLLSSVLPTSLTIGYEDLADLEIEHINHLPIHRLEDVPRALATPVDGFHKIEFRQPPKQIYLDPAELSAINRQIRERYRVTALENVSSPDDE